MMEAQNALCLGLNVSKIIKLTANSRVWILRALPVVQQATRRGLEITAKRMIYNALAITITANAKGLIGGIARNITVRIR